jgi:hypothetical protein
MTSNFIKGNRDRFGRLEGGETKKKFPGPGEYFKGRREPVKIIVSGCNFMSETER